MSTEMSNIVVESIIDDILKIIPNQLVDLYIDPPGRRPSPNTLRISETVKKLNRSEALELIYGVVDVTLFSIFGLVDSDFKEKRISIRASAMEPGDPVERLDLREAYRERVNPGGEVAD